MTGVPPVYASAPGAEADWVQLALLLDGWIVRIEFEGKRRPVTVKVRRVLGSGVRLGVLHWEDEAQDYVGPTTIDMAKAVRVVIL